MLFLCGAHPWNISLLRSQIKNAGGEGLYAWSSFIFIYLYIFKFHTFSTFLPDSDLASFFPPFHNPWGGKWIMEAIYLFFFDFAHYVRSLQLQGEWGKDEGRGGETEREIQCATLRWMFTFSPPFVFFECLLNHHRSSITLWFLFFQYYEMSYGLNIEMHKQVSDFCFLPAFGVILMLSLCFF